MSTRIRPYPFCRFVRPTLLLSLLGMLHLGAPPSAFPHGSAIDVLASPSGKLTPYLFPSGLPLGNPAEFAYFALEDRVLSPDPGFGIVNEANGIAKLTRLDLDVIKPLVFWDGMRQTSPNTTLTVASPDGIGTYLVGADTSRQTGMKWGIYPGGLFWDEHGFYFLNATNPATGLYGVWVQLTSPQYSASDPFLLPFLFDPDQRLTRAEIDAGIQRLLMGETTASGDLDRNGVLDANDIDQLTQRVRSGEYTAEFDCNQDGALDAIDRQWWVERYAKTYFGDSNVDGQFDTADLVQVMLAGQYDDALSGNSTWASGDWDGDGDFSSGDLILAFQAAGYEQGVRPAIAVPEPAIGMQWIGGLLWAVSSSLTIRKRSQTPVQPLHNSSAAG